MKGAAILIAIAITGCSRQQAIPLTRPAFAAPKNGVFNQPLPVVENTDDDMMPTLAPRTGFIAYVSKQSGNLDIFVRSQDTGVVRRLTTHSADDIDPAFSPDGKRIAWISQSDDVKGDVWVMDTDGEHKTQLTDRDAAESGPAWSSDGTTLFFTTRTAGGKPRIDALTLGERKRSVVINEAWDPAPTPNGSALVYVAADTTGIPRLYAKRSSDGRIAAITDGAYIDALPRVAVLGDQPMVVFTRFIDDSTSDGQVDVSDTPGLWTAPWSEDVFESGQVTLSRPLTPGAAGELFVATAGSWIAYTAAGYADLEIYALPDDGVVNHEASAAAVLEAARSEPDAGLRRVALRHLTATSPELRGRARYELGRELEERGKLAEARAELTHAVTDLAGDTQQGVTRIELVRVAALQALGGSFTTELVSAKRIIDDSRAEIDAIVQTYPGAAAVATRAATTRAELLLAEGHIATALAAFEAIAVVADVPTEDGARALDHATRIYSGFHDLSAIERTCAALVQRFSAERLYVERCAAAWVEAATTSAQGDPAAALEDMVRHHSKLPAIASKATYALGREQARIGHPALAIASWQRVASDYPSAASVVEEALVALGETAELVGDRESALRAYEQLLAQFGSDPRTRGRAKAGATRIALAKADNEESTGHLQAARDSYARLLATRRDNALAHRRYIALSAKLSHIDDVVAQYRNDAKARPRDATMRYAYGYALTFATPLDLDAAEREIGAALDLDPRFAAAHLTMGWIRMQRENQNPGRDWLDRAESSFRTAQELVDPEDDPQLWAAAQLNRANALLTLGKNDDAFYAYVARIQHPARFDDPLTELLFYESFARAAWRMDELDVALDMAHEEWLLGKRLPGGPRRATAAALQASIYLQAELYGDAVVWYERAEALYRERKDWTRVVPMLRGKALAMRWLGRDDEALATFGELLDLTREGIGVPEPDKPFFGFLAPEIAANPTNVTRAPYGFLAKQEEEVARAEATRTLRERGDLSQARNFAAQRLALIDEAAEDESMAQRIQLELMHALNESALLDVRAGDVAAATLHWGRALTIGQSNGYATETAIILESLAMLWARDPRSREPALTTRCRAIANALAEATRSTDAVTAARLDRWLALERFATLTRTSAPTKATSLDASLAQLDGMNEELDAVVNLAAADVGLSEHLRAYATRSTTVVSDTPDDFVGPPLAIADMVVASWRTAFDAAVAQATADRAPLDATRLMPAIEGYETYGGGRNAPERHLFLDSVSRALIDAKEIERSWRLLERSRLDDLVTNTRRRAAVVGRLAKRPMLARAIDRQPVTLAELRTVLAADGVLIQAFATRNDVWTWFVIDNKHIETVRTPPMQGAELPESVAALLGTPTGVVYVDVGHLEAPPAWEMTLGGKRLPLTCEALSATYLAAAYESVSLARNAALTFDALTVTRFSAEAPGRTIVRIRAKTISEEPSALIAGASQLTFEKPADAPDSEALDLDRLSATRLGGMMAWVDGAAPSRRVTRALAQAFLFAGVPTTLVGGMSGARLEEGIAKESPVKLVAAAADAGELTSGARLVGYRGIDFAERVDVAFQRLLQLARSAGAAYPKAQQSKVRDDWQRAHDDFADLVAIVELLMTPDAVEVLTASPRPGAAALAKALPTRILEMRDKLAQTLLALDDVDAAAALQMSLVESYRSEGKLDAALEQLLSMGKTFMNGERYRDAERVLSQCAEVARDNKLPLIEGDCRSRLGSAYRALFDYPKAKAEYVAAIAIYTTLKHPNQIYPRRFLGLLYESALNDYDEALREYEHALADAIALKVGALVPSLHLDIARSYRARGDFGLALESVERARASLRADDSVERTEAALEAAKIEWYRGDYPSALEQQSIALTLARTGRNDFQEIQALSLEGLIAMNQGDLRRARESTTSALDLARGSGRRREVAAQLDNLGNVLQREGKLDEAEARFREALDLDTQLGSAEGQAFDLRALAAVLERRGKVDDSLTTVERALTVSRAIGSRYNETQCLYVRGRALLAAGRAKEASASFEEARRLATQLSVPEIAWRASYAAGRIAEGAGDMARARAAFDEALAVAERLALASEEETGEESRDALYADAIRLAFAANDDAGAFLLAERMHARSLLDLVAASDVLFPSDEARTLVAGERRAREAVVAVERELTRGKNDATSTKLATAKAEQTNALGALRERYPGIARAFTIAPRSLAETRAALPEGAAVLVYLIGAKESDVLVVRHSGTKRIILDVSYADLRHATDAYREGLKAFGAVDAAAQVIANAVLKPLGNALKDVSHLVVVPHGPLVGIPFAALPWNGGQLVDAMASSYAPSASALVDTLSRQKPSRVRKVVAAAYGDDLPFARLEAIAVGGNAALTGALASETAVRELRADAVDIAAHGDVVSESPMHAGLRLAHVGIDDGHLELREIFGMQPLAPLVTLSACTLGSDSQSWQAVASAFFASGTQTIVATQERVSDLAAGVLMKRFYRERGKPANDALRAAQLWTRGYFAHPAHWATFALIGDFR